MDNSVIRQFAWKMQIQSENIILRKTFEFSLLVIEYVEILEGKRKYVIARQLLRSATSIGANVHALLEKETSTR